MNFIARDDICSLEKRKQGETVVCARFVAVDQLEIQDSSGKMSLPSLPNESVVSIGDTCLFLFECNPEGPPTLTRITLLPEELVPVYEHLLQAYRQPHSAATNTQS